MTLDGMRRLNEANAEKKKERLKIMFYPKRNEKQSSLFSNLVLDRRWAMVCFTTRYESKAHTNL